MEINVRLQHHLVAVQRDSDLHLLVELSAPPQPIDDTRQPLRVALVLDRSGSMTGEKLAAARRSARYLVEQLQPDDQLALIAYDDAVDLVAPLAVADKRRLVAEIDDSVFVELHGQTEMCFSNGFDFAIRSMFSEIRFQSSDIIP
jgi:hypothetical protein